MSQTAAVFAVPGGAVPGPARMRPVGVGWDDDLVQVVAAAADVRAGIAAAVRVLRREYAVDGVEWWMPAGDGASASVGLSSGQVTGPRIAVSVGAAGTIVVAGAAAARVAPAIARLRPLLHHWWTAERLAEHVGRLARRTAVLEDFAALVAHDVRSALVSALRSDAPGESLVGALEVVDSILEAARAEGGVGAAAPLPDTLRDALADLGDIGPTVTTSVTGELPIPAAALRFVLRNLLANAVAAGARSIHVSALARGDRHALVVADDGVGSTGGYASGTRLGLALCRRLLARFGGTLVLKRGAAGTRAVITLTGTPQ